jgi:2'-hydroxyisoflavone reductase
MKLLILGGTRFLGRHVAEQALQRGHRVTLLHRGRSAQGLFPQAQHLIADRDADLAPLDGGSWDAVIDTSAYFPRQVQAVATRLAGHVGHYHLVSSISAYGNADLHGTDEDAPLKVLPDPAVQVLDGDTYGGLKALCEAEAQRAFGGACLVSRPGLIVGPHDPTGRFSWWVQRLQRGGEILAPGDPATPVQFIDARDAAAWTLHLAEQAQSGVFNLCGPDTPMTWGSFLQRAHDTLAPTARLVWVDEAFVIGAGVAPWSDLPVWLPREQSGLLAADASRARKAGLRCRPLEQTLQDTARWLAEAPATTAPGGPARPAVGLSPEREANLLASWARTRDGGQNG